jgi:hypothetical protein
VPSLIGYFLPFPKYFEPTFSSQLGLDFFVVYEKLVKPSFSPANSASTFQSLNNIHHFVVTFLVLQAKHKNHLSPQSRVGFVRLAKTNVKKSEIWLISVMQFHQS